MSRNGIGSPSGTPIEPDEPGTPDPARPPDEPADLADKSGESDEPPDLPEDAPAEPAEPEDRAENTPDEPEKTPDLPEDTPDEAEHAPDLPEATPDELEALPEDASDEPDDPDVPPDQPEDEAEHQPEDEPEDEPEKVPDEPAAALAPAAAVADRDEPADPGASPATGEPERAKRSRKARYARRAAFGVLITFGLCALLFAIAYLLTPIPSAKSASIAAGSVFYYSDGKTQIARQGPNRTIVDLDKVPKPVREAVLAAENRSFYQDPGVSVQGTARAMWSTVSGGQVQGGSTITQQMVRNYYSGLSQERTVFRKLKEIMISMKVGNEKSKDWILEQYLNTIYFGRDAYGIEAAARAYFGVPVEKLTAAQGAYLAAAIQQPSSFGEAAPADRPAAEARWRYVLGGMVQMGSLSATEAAGLKFPTLAKQKLTNSLRGQIGYMKNIAIKELEERGYSEDEINRGGLKIRTTFDKGLMAAAAATVKADLPAGTSKKIMVGLVTVDPSSGAVKAFYGGEDYLETQLSTSFGSYVQAGSGFKPYVLAAALDQGLGLDYTVDGSSPQTFGGAQIHNDSNTSYGQVNLIEATQRSINTAYVNLGQKVGLDRITAMAENMGIPRKQLTANSANTVPSFPLGTVSLSPAQQAGAFATFAAEGVHHRTHVIASVTDAGGKEHKVKDESNRTFGKDVARDATYAMTRVVESGTGTRAQLDDGRPVAGKTGTTDRARALWFNGFVPQLATSVAVFNSNPNKPVTVPGFSSYGGSLPAQIWHDYMTVATQNLPIKEFGDPTFFDGDGGGSPPVPAPTTTRPRPETTAPSETPETPPTHSPELPTITPEPGPDEPEPGPTNPKPTKSPQAVRNVLPAGREQTRATARTQEVP
ncbi:transglycosylase domain-containing protein [Actinomadura scrupuli]|uniref:transglycosylase domain-containing protein n=1 Tax=Actinomadura scrupuli TaxID=559629 RepID=UPI003D9891EA